MYLIWFISCCIYSSIKILLYNYIFRNIIYNDKVVNINANVICVHSISYSEQIFSLCPIVFQRLIWLFNQRN